MRSPLVSSADLPRFGQWEKCTRCGEPMQHATDGMGRVRAECPVCDWGWKPRVPQRQARLAQEAREFVPEIVKTWDLPCAECGEVVTLRQNQRRDVPLHRHCRDLRNNRRAVEAMAKARAENRHHRPRCAGGCGRKLNRTSKGDRCKWCHAWKDVDARKRRAKPQPMRMILRSDNALGAARSQSSDVRRARHTTLPTDPNERDAA